MNILATRNIFIDTSIFKGIKFLWNHKYLKIITKLANSNEIQLFLTTITKREIIKKITEDVNSSISQMKKLRKEATILSSLKEYDKIFKRIDKEKLKKKLIDKFDKFCKESKCQIISTNNVQIDEVFSKYFDEQPPFKRSGKKFEFPDAFVLESLSNWCKKNNDQMYIISNDNDMKDFCKENEYLYFINNIPKFLNIFLSHIKYSIRIIQMFEDNIDKIHEKLKSEFEWLGFYLEDREGDVLSAELKDAEFDDINLIDLNNASAFFELDTLIKFEAEIYYDDYDTAIYDSEDKVLIPWQKIEETIENSYEASIIVEIKLNADDINDYSIEELTINDNQDVGIQVENILNYK